MRIAQVAALVAALVSALPLSPVHAQDGPRVGVGSRLRIMLDYHPMGEKYRKIVGEVTTFSADTLRLRAPAPRGSGERVLPIALEKIEEAAVNTGTRSIPVKGLAYGTVGGMALGSLLAVAFDEGPSDCATSGMGGTMRTCSHTLVDAAFQGAAIGGLGGAVVGLALGFLLRADVWEPISVDVLSRGGGWGVEVQLSVSR